MNGINKIFLAGNLGKKPVLRTNKEGGQFSFLNLATNRVSYKDGNWDKRTLWHSILVFGKKAEICQKYLEPGSPLAIEGFLESKDGEQNTIIAEDVHFLGLRSNPKDS